MLRLLKHIFFGWSLKQARRIEPTQVVDPVKEGRDDGWDLSKPPTFEEWRGRMRALGHTIFSKGDYNLNICGWRSEDPQLDKFKDWITVAYKVDAVWKFDVWQITTLAGKRYLVDKLLNREGAAILAAGQYPAYKIRKHRGKYNALCQDRAPVQVYRDGNRDEIFDMVTDKIREGYYGINIHKPYQADAQKVGSNSAGCQVFKRIKDFKKFMQLCYKAKAVWGNKFTYTLIERTNGHS